MDGPLEVLKNLASVLWNSIFPTIWDSWQKNKFLLAPVEFEYLHRLDPYSSLAVRSGKKSPNQETGLENRGRLKVLNDTKFILNDD